MIKRLQKSMDEKDEGFTLIELLVVIVIIGILAAIAIPLFLSQRSKAADSATKSDLKNAATLMETSYVDNQAYPTAVPTEFKASTGVTVTVDSTPPTGGFCLEGANTGGSQKWVYDSTRGGLQPKATIVCP